MSTMHSFRYCMLAVVLGTAAGLQPATALQAGETRTVTIAFEVFPPDPEAGMAIREHFENNAVGIVTDVPGDTVSSSFSLLCDGTYVGDFYDHGYMLFVTQGEAYKLRGYVFEQILPANRHGFMRLGPGSNATVETFWAIAGGGGVRSCTSYFSGRLLIVVTGEAVFP